MGLFDGKLSGLMGNMKMDREISDLETKKQSLVRSLQNEINSIESSIISQFTEIGSAAYDAYEAGTFSADVFTDKFSEISALKDSIKSKKAKVLEISSRYDEEITLLKNLNLANPANPANPVATEAGGNCTSCGAPRKETDVFCSNCGNKLV